ncbi:MAG: AAA family ATPase [Candidatus Odinarchaeota archaeon]
MKICHITLYNFRTFEYFDQDVGRHNTLVGQNNSGKSNLLWALSCFYNSNQLAINDIRKDEHGDFVNDGFRICLTFDDLNEEETRQNQKYLSNGKIKIELRGFFDESNKLVKEYHGYIKSFELKFPEGFDEELKSLLSSNTHPTVSVFETFPELNGVRNALDLEGRYSKDHWEKIKEEFLRRNSDIEKMPIEARSPDNYHGFIKTHRPEVIGKSIFIPAIKDPKDILYTGKTTTPIRQLVSELLSGVESEETIQKFHDFQEDLVRERKAHKTNLEEKFNEELKLWSTTVKIDLKEYDIKDSLPIEFELLFDDGVLTDLERKGTGLQRYVFFKFLKILNEIKLTPRNSIIFLFEEPEAHLHPQIQREIARILKDLTQNEESSYQTFLSTHSPQFIDMRNLDNVFIFKKLENFCTDSTKCQLNLKELKERINIMLFFDPHVSEIFFAEKVILVEGQSEQLLFNLLIQEDLLKVTNISIINTQSKFNILLFVKVLNSLKIPYCVMVDEDPFFLPYFKNPNREKIKGKKKAYKLNFTIGRAIDYSLGKLLIISPDLEGFLEISTSQRKKLRKPLVIYQKFVDLKREASPKINEIVDLFKLVLSPEELTFDISKQDGTKWTPIDEKSISLPISTLENVKNIIKNQLKGFKNFLLSLTNTEKEELKSLFDT